MTVKGRRISGTKIWPRAKRIGMAFIVMGVMLVSSYTFLLEPSKDVSAVAKAPNFTVKDTSGNNWTLRDFEGKKVVLIDLMAIPCESCKIVGKNIDRLYDDYKDDVFVISIDVWTDIDSEDELRDYKDEYSVRWPMAMDTDDILTKYSAQELAKIVIIKLNGRVGFEKTGVTKTDVIREKLDLALEDKLSDTEIWQPTLWLLAVFAGVASFFSPCAFPMFPGYIAFYFKKHMEMDEKKLKVGKAAASGTVAAMGIITVYIVIGGLVLGVGTFIIPYVEALELIIGAILIFLGALMMTKIQYDWIIDPFRKLGALLRGKKGSRKGQGAKKGAGFYSGLFIYGVGYGGAASACTLPVFLAVILAGYAEGNYVMGLALLLCYTLVTAGLMIGVTIIIAVVGHTAVQKIAKHTNTIKKISGFVLLLAGVYLVLFWLTAAGYIQVPGLS